MRTPRLDEVLPDPDRALDLARGEYLFRRGDSADAIYLVQRGRVRLERPLADGTPVTLGVLRRGQGVAEAALFSSRYHCDARAEVASRFLRFPKETVLDRLRSDPLGAEGLLEQLAGQVRRLRALLEIRSIRRADERVLAYLGLLESLGEKWDGDQPTSEIGVELGLAPETLYRSLSRLERGGLIARSGREIRRNP